MVFNKYYIAAITSIKEQMPQRSVLIGKLFVYSIVFYIFRQIFMEIPNSDDRIKYVAITQLIIFSVPTLALRLEEDIQNGLFAYFLFKPCHYLLIRFCESLGTYLLRLAVLFPLAIILIFQCTGTMLVNLTQMPLLLLYFFTGFLIFSLLQMLIGTLSFWLRDITPVLYLNQTATFCFGGLIIPITFYPAFWQKIVFFTPFPWILWWPAHLFTSMDNEITLLQAIPVIIFWIGLLSASIWALYNFAVHKLLKSGVV